MTLVALAALVAATSFASEPPGEEKTSPLPEAKKRVAHYHFAGIPWGTPADSALGRLSAHGFRAVPKARNRAMIACEGKLYDYWSLVHGFLDDQGGVVGWLVTIEPRSSDNQYPAMRATYDEVVRQLIGKYGPRRSVVDKFIFPYRGGGFEDRALQNGKAVIRSEWKSRQGDVLRVEMDRSIAVLVWYQSPEWFVSEARRRARKAADL